ncbi:MAG: hypothetical protein DKM50_08305 [Candidatus Margulisiibacteriota bacterium]|nr:MAG: hypothetical protein A2X43_03085 [Candidatus Margulisbacteria bacterium GWD2_39_127]OGI04997.1 MAG: hypothetical protein A2X42_05350 [Candidatus Margulisbacteria bacterium GWF2_38_17]OGI08993.1 MAG: hypothetical protein A2X41_01545 [Candidatus Margulisbacteria bacterium GWE2_39_32]PZM79597.1 MAG: hypothetical protein DKM50_08305 [Candidatus Margulisiibacteriota bacterium]HAR63221.1 hypothetical protein [Candidatus Margulisiibacteriota bacterium]
MNIEPELHVIRAFQQGDSDAFKTIYDLTQGYVYSIIYKMVLDREETKDLTHDIYVKIYENRKVYVPGNKFTTWLYRIATNHAINYLNKKRSFFIRLPQLFFHHSSDTSEYVVEEDIPPIQKALKQLKPEYRICVILRDIEDLSYEEIAEQLCVNIGTVRSRINRGRKQLLDSYIKEVGQYEIQEARQYSL